QASAVSLIPGAQGSSFAFYSKQNKASRSWSSAPQLRPQYHCSVLSERFDAIVVGLGAMGCAACWRLAQRGARVLGLDMYGAANALGSSSGGSRLFRMAYFEHPDYVPLLQAALAGWRELEAASGAALLTQCGGLYLGAPESDLVSGALAS